jgi:hypothetical protein
LTALVQGPNWTPAGLDVRPGRFPLRVETPVGNAVARLVPGVTAVTSHAPYYALHPLIWDECERRELDADESRELLRRCEVVVAGITHAHELHERPIGAAHGEEKVGPAIDASGALNVREMVRPNAYAAPAGGFSGAYLNSERVLGLVALGEPPSPGSRFRSELRSQLSGIFDLAGRDEIDLNELKSASDLCLCRAPDRADGELLATLLCDPLADDDFRRDDDIRRATVQLLLRVVRTVGVTGSLERGFARAVAFGDFAMTDDTASSLFVTPAWRGVVLRNYSVSAWRRIWAYIVDQLVGADPMSPSALAARIADELEEASGFASVEDLIRALPATTLDGQLLDAEEAVSTLEAPELVKDLMVLAIGASRADELEGRTRDVFLGRRDEELGPLWMQRLLESNRQRPLEAFVCDLAMRLIERARRVALSKAELTANGLFVPSRVHEREGLLFATSDEGRGPVGLRINSLGSLLFSVGVLDWTADDGGTWLTTARAERLL